MTTIGSQSFSLLPRQAFDSTPRLESDRTHTSVQVAWTVCCNRTPLAHRTWPFVGDRTKALMMVTSFPPRYLVHITSENLGGLSEHSKLFECLIIHQDGPLYIFRFSLILVGCDGRFKVAFHIASIPRENVTDTNEFLRIESTSRRSRDTCTPA